MFALHEKGDIHNFPCAGEISNDTEVEIVDVPFFPLRPLNRPRSSPLPIEIEAKMVLPDAPAVEARLAKLGAKPQPAIAETNVFFDTPQATLKAADQGLRLRVEKGIDGDHHAVIITHKGPRAHGRLKSRSETELKVHSARDGAALLRALGYVKVFSFEKRRSQWLLDDCIVALDTLPLLGDFIEIEGPNDEAVMAAREKLELEQRPLITASYISMLKTHLVEKGRNVDEVRFPKKA